MVSPQLPRHQGNPLGAGSDPQQPCWHTCSDGGESGCLGTPASALAIAQALLGLSFSETRGMLLWRVLGLSTYLSSACHQC